MSELKMNARRGNAAKGVCEIMGLDEGVLTGSVNLFGKEVLEYAGQVLNLRTAYEIQSGRKVTTWYDCMLTPGERKFESDEEFSEFIWSVLSDLFPYCQCVYVTMRKGQKRQARVFVSAVRIDGGKLILRLRDIKVLEKRFSKMCGE